MKQLLLTLSLSILFIPFGMSQGTTNRNSDMILPHATSVESNTSIRDTIGTLIESNSTNTDSYDKFTGFQSQVNGTSGNNYAIRGINLGNSNYRNYGIRGEAKNAENLNVGVVGTSYSEIGNNYAVWGIAKGAPGQNRGVIGYATQPTDGQNYGVTGWVGGSEQFNIAIGGYADAADSTNGWNAGLMARASATTENGINYGARTEAGNAPTNYGVHAVAYGNNAVSNIGIYASASNGQSNKAAVFEGEVDLVGNPIKNIANPVDDQDAVSLAFLLEKINILQNQIDVLKSTSGSGTVNSDLVGQWVLLHEAKALWVGETMELYAAGGQWWSNSLSDIKTRACFFDDIYEFKDDMSFHNILGDETWQEGGWESVAEGGCGAALAPFDGTATATWSHNPEDGTITIDGMGAFLGISRVANGAELTDPAQAKESLTYSGAVISEDKNQLTVHIQMGAGFWQFKFARVGSAGAQLPTTDVDGDGVLDVDDDCPDVYGEAASGCPVEETPNTAPAAPTRDQSEVSSIYSDSYTAPESWDPYPNWGQATQYSEIDIDGNKILGYSQLNYQGNAFSGVDLTGKTMIHMDIYSADISALKVVLINTQADGGTFETGLDASLENGAWTSVDISLSDFEGFVGSGGNLDQIKYEVGTDATATGDKSFFIDNIYVY
jgi:hypothetical protein